MIGKPEWFKVSYKGIWPVKKEGYFYCLTIIGIFGFLYLLEYLNIAIEYLKQIFIVLIVIFIIDIIHLQTQIKNHKKKT